MPLEKKTPPFSFLPRCLVKSDEFQLLYISQQIENATKRLHKG